MLLKSIPCSAQRRAGNPGPRSDTRQEQTLKPSVGLMKGFLKSKIREGIKTNRAEHVREEHGRPSESQRLKEAILGTEDLTGMLEASVPSGSHSFPGDFCAFAEPPGRCHPCRGGQQTWLFKGKYVMEPL